MTEEEVRSVELFKALSNPIRYSLIKVLSQGEKTVSELSRLVGRDMSNISQHLATLRLVKLVRYRTVGKHIYYRLKNPAIMDLLEGVRKIVARKSKT